jgi:16S rRNA (adenine1518-N6/adenine1519-N6)-dimethyltransferase
MTPPRQEKRLDRLKALFAAHGIRPHIRFGQNFLLDTNQVNLVARLGEVGPGDLVLEVGVGTGFLTRVLAEAGARVVGVEIDRRMAALAREEVGALPAVEIVEGDVLAGKNALNPGVLARVAEHLPPEGSGALKCVSNLPYGAGTPFVANLCRSELPWRLGVFMLQYEVARRLAAAPATDDYGALTVAAALAGEATVARRVPPQVFWPRPKVASAIVRLEFLPAAERAALPWDDLRRVTAAVFTARRKTLLNAFKGRIDRERAAAAIAGAGLDPDRRGETLAPEEFLALARALRTLLPDAGGPRRREDA